MDYGVCPSSHYSANLPSLDKKELEREEGKHLQILHQSTKGTSKTINRERQPLWRASTLTLAVNKTSI